MGKAYVPETVENSSRRPEQGVFLVAGKVSERILL